MTGQTVGTGQKGTGQKGKHSRCRTSPHRLALLADGTVGLFDASCSTRVVRAFDNSLHHNPSQAQMDDINALGAATELVLPKKYAAANALRLAGEVFSGVRPESELGAWRTPVLSCLTDSPRQVKTALRHRLTLMEYAGFVRDRPRRLLPEHLRTAQVTRLVESTRQAHTFNSMALRTMRVLPDEFSALVAFELFHRMKKKFDPNLSLAKGWPANLKNVLASYSDLDVRAWCEIQQARKNLTDEINQTSSKVKAVGALVVFHHDFLSKILSECETSQQFTRVLRLATPTSATNKIVSTVSGYQISSIAQNMLLQEQLANTTVPYDVLPGSFETLTLARHGMLVDSRVAGFSHQQLVVLAGMLERGVPADEAIEKILALSLSSGDASLLLGLDVCDEPASTRKGLAEQANRGDHDMLRRWVSHRAGIEWETADAVLHELGQLHSTLVGRAAGSLSASGLQAAESWAHSEGIPNSGGPMLKVAALFSKAVGQWQDKALRFDVSLHDMAYWLPEVGSISSADSKSLSRYLLANVGKSGPEGLPSELASLRTIAAQWPVLSPEQRMLRPKALVASIMAVGYGDAGFTSLGKLAGSLRVAPRTAAAAAGVWASSLNAVSWLPSGQRIAGDLAVEFLDRTDPRGVFLGELSDCCQSIHSEGHDCAVHGQSRDDGGFLIVQDAKGDVVAQGWCWLDRKGRGVCIDSIESKGGFRRSNAVTSAVEAACDWLIEDGHANVNVGAGFQSSRRFKDVSMDWFDYKGYSDAYHQRTVASRGDGFKNVPVEVTPVVSDLESPVPPSLVGHPGLMVTFGSRLQMRLSRFPSFTNQALCVSGFQLLDDKGVPIPDGLSDPPDSALLADLLPSAARWLAARGVPVVDESPDGILSGLLTSRGVSSSPESLRPVLGELCDTVVSLESQHANSPESPGVSSQEVETIIEKTCLTSSKLGQQGSFFQHFDAYDDDDVHGVYDYDYDEYWPEYSQADGVIPLSTASLLDARQVGVLAPSVDVFDDADFSWPLDLQEKLCDLSDYAVWEDSSIVSEHEPDASFNRQRELGAISLTHAVARSTDSVPLEVRRVADVLFPGHLEALQAASVPVKVMYVLGQVGWSASEVVGLWTSLVAEDTTYGEKFTAIRLVGAYGLKPHEVRQWNLTQDIQAAVELAADQQGMSTKNPVHIAGLRVAADVYDEIESWFNVSSEGVAL